MHHYFSYKFANRVTLGSLSTVPISFRVSVVFLLLPCATAYAAGDAAKGRDQWIYTCQHCHGQPQPRNPAAFSDYDKTANQLADYAANPSAITRAANEGYTIPQGNTNNDYAPGTSSRFPMGSWAGMAQNKLGLGTTPTQYAIDISAYFATFFDVPKSVDIESVIAGNAQATLSFTKPHSELPIVSYLVTSNPDGKTATGTGSPITVTGLGNGTAYTFNIVAISNAGTGKPSSASRPVTPFSAVVTPAEATITPASNVAAPEKVLPVPVVASIAPLKTSAISVTDTPTPTNESGVPIITRVRPGNAEAIVFFTVPKNSGVTFTGYTVSVLSDGTPTGIVASGAQSPIKISGLSNGKSYTFTVTGNDGKGYTSQPSSLVTPLRILGD